MMKLATFIALGANESDVRAGSSNHRYFTQLLQFTCDSSIIDFEKPEGLRIKVVDVRSGSAGTIPLLFSRITFL